MSHCQLFKSYSTLPVIKDIHVPRLVIGKGRIIIHGFTDASTATYGAVLYTQSISEEDVSKRLLCSKSCVAPVKTITIPRLELYVIVTASTKDENQIWRVGGRLKNPDLTYSQKHPAILPEDHFFTKLIMINIRNRNFHLGPQTLVYCTRQRFWPLHGSSIGRKIVQECVVCFKNKPIVAHQLEGSLPREKVNPSFPFLHTGIDLKGRPSPRCLGFDHIRLPCYIEAFCG
ncbi:integrase catalytic domain-containing protein [Trichonephila clavipes]|nr:integrase catalytic domain-containing protein [Trichonephila clavipes]